MSNDDSTSNTANISTARPISLTTQTRMPGPFQNYKYGAFINSPEEMGMKGGDADGWGLDTIGTNFGGLISYVELLVTGTSEASKAAAIDYSIGGARFGQPLGNAYTFSTGFQCMDGVNRRDAVAYINNIPLGNIPFISDFMGAGDVKELRGLLPGIFEDFNGFNPMQIVDALDISNLAPCNPEVAHDIAYRLPISNINSDGTDYKHGVDPVTYENLYMFDSMVSTIDPCLFQGDPDGGKKRNPVTGKTCVENFANIENSDSGSGSGSSSFASVNNINTRLQSEIDKNLEMLARLQNEDWLVQIYFISFVLLIVFITIRLLNRTCSIPRPARS